MNTPVKDQIRSVSILEMSKIAILRKLAFCVYKLPNSDIVHFLADSAPDLNQDLSELENIKGFLFAPFEATEQKPVLLIKPEFNFTFGTTQQVVTISHEEYHDFTKGIKIEPSKIHFYQKNTHHYFVNKEEYKRNVELAIENIKIGTLKKVVLSRSEERILPNYFEPLDFFIKLCSSYPSGFTSLVSSPETGTWLGSTPELLLSLEDNKIFNTVSLAGTKLKNENDDVSTVSWTQKEIEEQALVSRYIINCFKKIRLREYEETGPKTVAAGNLLHLKTEFKIDLNEVHFENLSSVMLGLLHPTSAICGMPKEDALALINKLEKEDRVYYSGFLGPVNINSDQQNSENSGIKLSVNIRCMQLFHERAILYAGAGITEESDAEKEYIETKNKMDTLLKVMEI